jgi:Cu+-exporting ATPase
MSDNSDALVIEKNIAALPGVLKTQVNAATGTLRVEFLPTAVNQTDLQSALRKLGYKVSEASTAEDAEAKARKKEFYQQRHYLIVGLIFTIPLFILSMVTDLGFLPDSMTHATWIKWVMFALATPVQFYVGWGFYTGAWNSLRQWALPRPISIHCRFYSIFFRGMFTLKPRRLLLL